METKGKEKEEKENNKKHIFRFSFSFCSSFSFPGGAEGYIVGRCVLRRQVGENKKSPGLA